jgi:hypothetical protein
MEGKSYTGTVHDTASAGRRKPSIVVDLDAQVEPPPAGSKVRVTLTLSDEELGQRLREAFEGYSREDANDLIEQIDNYGGNADLAKLILEVTP